MKCCYFCILVQFVVCTKSEWMWDAFSPESDYKQHDMCHKPFYECVVWNGLLKVNIWAAALFFNLFFRFNNLSFFSPPTSILRCWQGWMCIQLSLMASSRSTTSKATRLSATLSKLIPVICRLHPSLPGLGTSQLVHFKGEVIFRPLGTKRPCSNRLFTWVQQCWRFRISLWQK